MSKFFKKFGAALVLAAMLGGCREEMPSLGEDSSAETSSAVTNAVPAKEDKETSEETSASQTKASETVSERYDISDEQAALEKLISEAAKNAENKKEYSVRSPIFGDFDGDGVKELIALYGMYSEEFFGTEGDVWFASGDNAECIAESGSWLEPKILTSVGKTLIKIENCSITTSSVSRYFLLENSSVSEYNGVPRGQGVYPDGEFGDFTAVHDAYDMSYIWDKSDMDSDPLNMGHTWKTYWYYVMDGESYSYRGREITEEEFLRYEGARVVLAEAAADEWEVKNIIKRGNGIINVNLKNTYETEDFFSEGYCNKILMYRNGKLFDITENYDDGGNYWYRESTEQTDFERFSEMIYDTAEGDDNSFIRERFYGDHDNDGRNELYAYYGTDENFSLWFADDNGARQASEEELAGIAQTL